MAEWLRCKSARMSLFQQPSTIQKFALYLCLAQLIGSCMGAAKGQIIQGTANENASSIPISNYIKHLHNSSELPKPS